MTPAHTHRPTLGAGTKKHDYNVSKKYAENWLYFTVQLGHVWRIKNCTKWYYAPKCTAEKPLYCGNKYWNVQKNVGEPHEIKTLYYKVMYWKVLVRPRLRGLVGAQGSRTLLRGHALGIPL